MQDLEPSPERLLALLHRWRDESVRAGRTITRIAVAFEAGRDGFFPGAPDMMRERLRGTSPATQHGVLAGGAMAFYGLN